MTAAWWLAALVHLAVPAAAPPEQSVVVLRMETRGGVSEDTGVMLTKVLASDIKDRGTFSSVASYADIQSLVTLEQQKQLLECNAASCLAEIAGALGTQFVVTSSVGKLGKSWLLTITLVDTRNAQTAGGVTESVPGDDEAALPAAVNRAVHKLLEKEKRLKEGTVAPAPVAAAPSSPPVEKPAQEPVARKAEPTPAAAEKNAEKNAEESGGGGPRKSTIFGLSSIPAFVLSGLSAGTFVLSLVGFAAAGLLAMAAIGSLEFDEASADIYALMSMGVGVPSTVLIPLSAVCVVAFAITGVVLLALAVVARGAEAVQDALAQRDERDVELRRVRHAP